MQSLLFQKCNLKRKVSVPSSKSYANRALIIASLLKDSPLIRHLPEASDVTILLDCLKAIGLQFEVIGDTVKFKNSFPASEKSSHIEVSVGEGGTTARFLASMLLLGKSEYTLILGQRLKDRPWQEFLDLVREMGGKAHLNGNKLVLQGPIKLPSELKIDCSKTTQFATGFQLLSAVQKMRVIPVNMNSSQSYWAMTEKLTSELPGLSTYDVPRDWSSASYPLAFGALNHEIEFPGLYPDEFQADSKFFDILTTFDCIETTNEGLKVKPIKSHQSVIFDVSDCLDLVPTLGYFLGHIQGHHKLTGISNLVHKESDRLNEVIKLLWTFKRKASTDGETLFIEGDSGRLSEKFDLVMPDDHRMVMSGTLFLIHHAGGSIAPSVAVSKSYPHFFDLISSI